MHDEQPLADLHHHFHIMLDEEDCESAALALADERDQVDRFFAAESSERLIEEQQFRSERQSLGDFHPAPQQVSQTGRQLVAKWAKSEKLK